METITEILRRWVELNHDTEDANYEIIRQLLGDTQDALHTLSDEHE